MIFVNIKERTVDNLFSSHFKVIMLVNYDDASRIAIKWFLAYFNFEVHSARTGEEALTLFDPTLHALIVANNSLPGMNGQELAHIIKLRAPKTPVIVFDGESPTNSDCLDRVVVKPTQLLLLQKTIEALLRPSFEAVERTQL
jgi:DNA-binding response OmpR family regulator